MCMGMGNAGFPSPHGIPMGMGTKFLKTMGMGRIWDGYGTDMGIA